MVSLLIDIFQNQFNLGQLESEIVTSIIIFLLAIMIGWIAYSVFKKYLVKWAKQTKSKIDDEILRNIRAPIILLALIMGLHFALQPISFLGSYSGTIYQLFSVAQILVATFIIARVLGILVSWFGERAKSENRMSEHLLSILKQAIRAICYVFALFAIMSVYNIELSGIVVGLGVGGIAIALALQNILADAFGAFLIYFDRPFEIGDLIMIGEYCGNVKKIGIRSTRIKLLQGEELVISNRELTTTNIRNFKKLRKRRVVLKFGVATDTPVEKLKNIPQMIKQIVSEVKLAEFDRAHLSEFGNFTLNYEVVYYIKTPNYGKYMDIKQAINFGLLEAFEKEKIVMPYPTQTILFEKD
jgi:small-conductance mechanosensitive channel